MVNQKAHTVRVKVIIILSIIALIFLRLFTKPGLSFGKEIGELISSLRSKNYIIKLS